MTEGVKKLSFEQWSVIDGISRPPDWTSLITHNRRILTSFPLLVTGGLCRPLLICSGIPSVRVRGAA